MNRIFSLDGERLWRYGAASLHQASRIGVKERNLSARLSTSVKTAERTFVPSPVPKASRGNKFSEKNHSAQGQNGNKLQNNPQRKLESYEQEARDRAAVVPESRNGRIDLTGLAKKSSTSNVRTGQKIGNLTEDASRSQGKKQQQKTLERIDMTKLVTTTDVSSASGSINTRSSIQRTDTSSKQATSSVPHIALPSIDLTKLKSDSKATQSQQTGLKNERSVQNTPRETPASSLCVTFPADQEHLTLKDLANMTNLGIDRLMRHLIEIGAAETEIIPPRVLEQLKGGRSTSRMAISQTAASIQLPLDVCELLLLEMGVQVKHAADDKQDRQRSKATLETPRRAPIVVVMGHVDHGKTTLLDALRNTNTVASEQGGITQAIAAFRVEMAGGLNACFLDTPGHEAFSSMRKSGTAVTDVACVVIAATDGVMPQTIESINYARAANLPVVFAITKTDMAKARASSPLTDEDIETSIVDQLNSTGHYDVNSDIFVKVVAPQKVGLDELLEAIRLQVELNEEKLLARSEVNAPGEAVVLESKIDRGQGPVADLVTRWGTMKVGDYVVCEDRWARIRRLELSDGSAVSSCPPAMPIRLSGFESSLPPGADVLVVPDGERECKRIVEYRQRKRARAHENEVKRKLIREMMEMRTNQQNSIAEKQLKGRKSLNEKKIQRKLQQEKLEQDLSEQEERRQREVRVILKANAEGSLNALQFAVNQMKNSGSIPEAFDLVIVKSGIGAFSEQDLELAQTTDSYILGFNLKLPSSLAKKAKNMNLLGVFSHGVIYNLLEDFSLQVNAQHVQADNNGEDESAAKVKGTAQVLEVFDLKGKEKKQVAGIRVLDGVLNKNDAYILRRGDDVVAELKAIESLRILKKDVPLVEKGSECGLALKDFWGFQVGDILEAVDFPVKS